MICGCEAVKDKESWHRHRQLPKCDAAHDYVRDKSRKKYARKRAREGHTVTPMLARVWRPGTEVVVPEEDPL